MKTILLITLSLVSISAFSKISDIYSTIESEYISFEAFINELPSNGHIVMGEFHNDELIQGAQRNIIESKVNMDNLNGQFSVMWEFLNYTDQKTNRDHFQNLVEDKITAQEFITNTAGPQNLSYASIFDITAKKKGSITGINIPRSLKQMVVKGGIDAIDPNYIPTAHYVGGNDYLARFTAAMGGHVPAQKIQSYFLAQCLTDSVMAEQIHLNNQMPLNFIIAGSFHTDFYDGTVVRLKNSYNYNNIVTLKIINKNNLSEAELEVYTSGDSIYGRFADYIIITE